MISISSHLLVSESIIIMPVICTKDRAICPRKAVYLSNSQLVYIGSAAIDVLGAFFLVASSIASADVCVYLFTYPDQQSVHRTQSFLAHQTFYKKEVENVINQIRSRTQYKMSHRCYIITHSDSLQNAMATEIEYSQSPLLGKLG